MARAALIMLSLALLVLPSAASGYHLIGGRWPVSTVGYFVEVPAYQWSADAAAYAWNTSGADFRFVKAPSARADVLIGIRWYKVAGDAHVQRFGRTFISARVGVQSGQDRYTMALVLAHELGHVLGLDHESRGCATMNPSVVDDHTTSCPVPPEGMWTCRLLQPDDVRGAVSLYGGSVRPWRGSAFCPR